MKSIIMLVFVALLSWFGLPARAAKVAYVVSGNIPAKVNTPWIDLGKRFGENIEIVSSDIFKTPEKVAEYDAFIFVGPSGEGEGNCLKFTSEEYATMENYVKNGGIVVLQNGYACNSDETDWVIQDLEGGSKGRCGIPRAIGAASAGGIVVPADMIRFTQKNPLVGDIDVNVWLPLQKTPEGKLQNVGKLNKIMGLNPALIAECKAGSETTASVNVISYNEYEAGIGIWFAIPVDQAAQYKDGIYLKLVKNLFTLIGEHAKTRNK